MNIRRPRHGSLQYWPRTKAKRIYPRLKNQPTSKNLSVLGFAGYKAGMTHVLFTDERAGSHTKGEQVAWPVTVIECPPLKAYGINFYFKDAYGLKLSNSLLFSKLDKILGKKLKLPKKYDYESKLKELEPKLNDYCDIRLLVHTQPRLTPINKKKPETFEMAIGGDDVKAKFDFAKNLLGNEIKVNDIIKTGLFVDVHSVSKGKGFQGTVKRFGVHLRRHKAEKKKRGNIVGPERPYKVHWGMIMPGRMGYNNRTEYNKKVVLVGSKPEEINPKGGFMHYGFVKNDYILVKGSVPGPNKRLIRVTEARRVNIIKQTQKAQINIGYVSKESKQ